VIKKKTRSSAKKRYSVLKDAFYNLPVMRIMTADYPTAKYITHACYKSSYISVFVTALLSIIN